MKYRYSRFTGEDLDDLDLEELLSKLSDLLLSSGFDNPYGLPYDDGMPGHSGEALHDAILEALLNGGMLSDEMIEKLLGKDWQQADDAEERIERLVQQILDKLQRQGYLTSAPAPQSEMQIRVGPARVGAAPKRPSGSRSPTRASIFSDIARSATCWDRSARAASDATTPARWQPASRRAARAKVYEFGDTMNLDASGTILNAVMREKAVGKGGIEVDYEDLMVVQGEYQSSCATVVMLDCSHSMILYGEDRFTPAKRVALALSNLIRLQYPGDALKVVLFHDSAEEIPLQQLARVRVGPYYTNTREGLRLARRILERQQKDMRQIVMITDGKPSALTRPDGRIYRNAFGLDPFIVSETFAEVAACRKAGILINTFMLARDPDLVSFVRRVAQICHGKAYFTTPRTLGQYVLMDYMDKKTRTIH